MRERERFILVCCESRSRFKGVFHSTSRLVIRGLDLILPINLHIVYSVPMRTVYGANCPIAMARDEFQLLRDFALIKVRDTYCLHHIHHSNIVTYRRLALGLQAVFGRLCALGRSSLLQ